MEITTDSYRLDRMERRTEEVQRELRRRFNHVENCFQHFEDRRIALGEDGAPGPPILGIGAGLLVLVSISPLGSLGRAEED